MKKTVKTTKATKTKKVAKVSKLTKKQAEEMVGLTANQAKALNYVIKEMAAWKDGEPEFSHVGIKEVTNLFKSPYVGGAVISTLIEKGLISLSPSPTENRDILGKYIVYLTDKSQKLR